MVLQLFTSISRRRRRRHKQSAVVPCTQYLCHTRPQRRSLKSVIQLPDAPILERAHAPVQTESVLQQLHLKQLKQLLDMLYDPPEIQLYLSQFGVGNTDECTDLQQSLHDAPLLFQYSTSLFQQLNLAEVHSLVHFGCGMGRVQLQAFLQYSNLYYVAGVEINRSRFLVGVAAMKRLAQANPDFYKYEEIYCTSSSSIQSTETLLTARLITANNLRRCEIHCGNMYDWSFVSVALKAEVFICGLNTITQDNYNDVYQILHLLKFDTRVLTYYNLESIYKHLQHNSCPFISHTLNHASNVFPSVHMYNKIA